MLFILLVLLSAFLIEGIGTYVSVVGLSALFAANPVIIVLAIALDLGKVVGVSFLYKYFKKINVVMKSYMTAAVVTLMLITSAGAFGYLSKEFQKAIQGTNQNTILVQSLQDEQVRLQHRKEEIDAQIAKLPDNVIRGRKQLIQQFAPEQDKITARLGEIDKQLPQLKIDSITKNTDVGPIIYIAQAFNTDPEHAVKWVIFIIIFVFDPLAISLLLAGNYLIDEREKRKLAQAKHSSPLSQYGFDESDIEDEQPLPAKQSMIATDYPELPEQKSYQLPEPRSYPPMPSVPPPKPEGMIPVDESPVVIGPPAPLPTPEELHEALGRERYVEPAVDELDHLTHEDLGRQKPNDVEFQQPQSGRVLPATKPREVITKDQITQPAKSQLENSAIRDQETDVGLGVKVR